MDPLTGLFRIFYWPLCRAYSRHLGDRPADSFLRYLCIPQFWKTYRFWPNFVKPRRFSEKVWSRQLNERDPILTLISDKFRVRDYVSGKVGNDFLIPLLWHGDKPEEIPFNDLPLRFVIKANHGCEYNIIVKDRRQLDCTAVKRQLNEWMDKRFGQDTYLGIAWAYKNIKPHIIIESFIGENCKSPEDFKFFCFSGRMEFFKIDFARFEKHAAKYFDRNIEELDLCEVGFEKYQGGVNFPDNFKDMVRVAESLSKGFSFMRVDLYSTKNRIYFGELTPYPGGINQKFRPEGFDYVFGQKWEWK